MSIQTEIAAAINMLRETKPLVHHITNYVTVNDCANITLGIGASPIMADDLREAKEIASIASALVVNMGTLHERTMESMLAAGAAANKKGVPVLLDPVGAGASALRNSFAGIFLKKINPAVIRGNISEIRFLGGISSATKGVDAASSDATEQQEAIALARQIAAAQNCTVAITGAVDIITDGKRTVLVKNGHKKLGDITGTGCMCSSLIASFLGAGADGVIASAGGIAAMGMAGERAYAHTANKGNGSFRVALHDAISNTTAQTYMEGGRLYEV